MMRLESEIFHKILNKLYKKRGCDALSIHDAIVILDTGKTNQYAHNEIEGIMKKVYEGYNLCPTCFIEFYDPSKYKGRMDMNKSNTGQINDYIAILKSSKDTSDVQLLKDINESDVEISIINGDIVIEKI